MRQKCDCGFIRRTCVALNSEFTLSGMSASGKCLERRLFNLADENIEGRRTLILRKIVRQWNAKEKADNGAVCVAIWPSFFFLFGGKTFTHAQYISIMYALGSTRQKFDV